MSVLESIRICGTDDLRKLRRTGEELGLDGNLTDEVVEKLDPLGAHVLVVYAADHRVSDSSSLPVHHQAVVLIKLSGENTPHMVAMGVAHEQWSKLYTEIDVELSPVNVADMPQCLT